MCTDLTGLEWVAVFLLVLVTGEHCIAPALGIPAEPVRGIFGGRAR